MKQTLRLRGELCPITKPPIKVLYTIYITFTIVLVSCVCTRAQVSASSQEVGPAAEAVKQPTVAQHLNGVVVSAVDGRTLEGATVKVKHTSLATLTDEKGEFLLVTNRREGVLEVSFLGYQTQEVPFSDTNHKLTISLEPDEGLLEEVMVSTGYQEIPKVRATGSFQNIDMETFESRVSPDVISRLNGIGSGLLFNANTTSSERTGGFDITIRGRSTIFANDQPLIVVDNFPYSGDINDINPSDVAEITILKDAAASSIWGVRAGNGVIVITTKKGKFGKPLNIHFKSSVTVGDKPDLYYNPNRLNSSEYIELEKFLFEKGYYDEYLNDKRNHPLISPAVEMLADNLAGNVTTVVLDQELNRLQETDINEQLGKYFYRQSLKQQYTLDFNGGAEKASYFFSAGYNKNQAALRYNSDDRLTLSSRNVYRPNDQLEVSIGLNFIQSSKKSDKTLRSLVGKVFPYSSFVGPDGGALAVPFAYRNSFVEGAVQNGFLDWSYYPVRELGNHDNTAKSNSLRLNTGLKYTLGRGFTIEAKYQYLKSVLQQRDYKEADSYYVRNLVNRYAEVSDGKVIGYNFPQGGVLGLTDGRHISNNLRIQTNYHYMGLNHDVAILAGYEVSEAANQSHSMGLLGYDDEVGTFANVNTTTTYGLNPSGFGAIGNGLGTGRTVSRFRSWFSNLAYTYKKRYTLSASGRIDGSNYFGVSVNQKSVPLWSVGAKWALDEEPFFSMQWLSRLKLRASYGYNGNLDRSVTGVTTFRYVNNAYWTGFRYAVTSNIGNPDLRWERSGILNLAVDFSTARNILTGSFDFFIKSGKDLIGFRKFASNAGITSLKGNYSDMEGHGFDLSITTKNINRALVWSTSFLLSYATDKVTRYDVVPTTRSVSSADGNTSLPVPLLDKPVFGIFAYKWAGLAPLTGDPIGYFEGERSQDYASILDNTPIESLIYLGTARPKWYGGISNQFRFKNFSLSFQINYKLGYFFRRPSINYNLITATQSPYLNVNRDLNSRWKKQGDEKTTNVPALTYPFNGSRDDFYRFSEINIEKGDHIRLQNINLNYDFNSVHFTRLPLKSITVFLYVDNVGILWRANKKDIDPDAVPAYLDNTTMPNSRTIAFGLKGNF